MLCAPRRILLPRDSGTARRRRLEKQVEQARRTNERRDYRRRKWPACALVVSLLRGIIVGAISVNFVSDNRARSDNGRKTKVSETSSPFPFATRLSLCNLSLGIIKGCSHRGEYRKFSHTGTYSICSRCNRNERENQWANVNRICDSHLSFKIYHQTCART